MRPRVHRIDQEWMRMVTIPWKAYASEIGEIGYSFLGSRWDWSKGVCGIGVYGMGEWLYKKFFREQIRLVRMGGIGLNFGGSTLNWAKMSVEWVGLATVFWEHIGLVKSVRGMGGIGHSSLGSRWDWSKVCMERVGLVKSVCGMGAIGYSCLGSMRD